MPARVLAFGPFELRPVERMLLKEGQPVRLGGRAMDLLIALADRAGEVVSGPELVSKVWPNVAVGDTTLRVHVLALRKALQCADGPAGKPITTVAGRGYSLSWPVGSIAGGRDPAPRSGPPTLAKVNRIIGRDAMLTAVSSKIEQRRFVTIVGPGGVGKTALAAACSEYIAEHFEDGIFFIDVASLPEATLVASALASALGIANRREHVVPDLVEYLRNKAILLVFDSCEFQLEAAAAVLETLVERTTKVGVLATSREPLRARGEWIQRLAPLRVPESSEVDAAMALGHSAIELFVEKASATLDDFKFTDQNAAVVAEICRKVDGIPLALEFVAARVDQMSLPKLSRMLDDRLRLLGGVIRRTSQGRHRTLRATLDWSYELLTAEEQLVLRRLSVFATSFTSTVAYRVTGGPSPNEIEFGEIVAALAVKSLLVADFDASETTYSLLDTTRLYAAEKLDESGERPETARRHASYFRDLMEEAEKKAERQSALEWLPTYGGHIADVRSALDWAFSADGDQDLAVQLTIFAVPLWTRLLLLRECRMQLERALSRRDLAPYVKMRLFAGLGALAGHADLTAAEFEDPWRHAFDLATQLGDVDFQTRALWGLWVQRQIEGKFTVALKFARHFKEIAESIDDRDLSLIGDRFIGYTLHFLGDQAGASFHVERMIQGYSGKSRREHLYRFQFDHPVGALITKSWVSWLQGFPEKAIECTRRAVTEATSIAHPLSLGNLLAKSACPIMLLSGDAGEAKRLVDLFSEHTTPGSLAIWQIISQCFEGLLLIREDELTPGLAVLQDALDRFRGGRFIFPYTWVLGELALARSRNGQHEVAASAIDQAIAQSHDDEELWCYPELLRVKGECLRREGLPGSAGEAETYFDRSLQLARQQGCASWELRSSMSLADLWSSQGKRSQAFSLLSGITGRFVEGFETIDFVRAKKQLSDLSAPYS